MRKTLFKDKYVGYHTFGLGIDGTKQLKNQEHDYSKDYLTFTAVEAGTFTLNIPQDNYGGVLDVTSISYSIDNGSTWVTTQRVSDSITSITTPKLYAGDKVLWKGVANRLFDNAGPGSISQFTSTGIFDVSGNINSLFYNDEFSNHTESKILKSLFEESLVRDASNLILPAINLDEICYKWMFKNCTSLTTAPELPAMELAEDCYSGMFLNCTSLVAAPKLPATTLVSKCYEAMFMGCSSLNYIKMMSLNPISGPYATNWVVDVAQSGTFIKNSEAVWDNQFGISTIPEGWTVKTASK